MGKKKSIIILVLSLVFISLVSYIAFGAEEDDGGKSPLDYGLFASENIQVAGSGCDIKADIWANNFLGFYGNSFVVRGKTWSKNDIKKGDTYWDSSNNAWQNSGLNIGDRNHTITTRKEMIRIIDELENGALSNGIVYEGNKTISNIDLSKSAIIKNGGITSGSLSKINNSLIADKDIDISVNTGTNSNQQDISNMNPVIIASRDGNIKINGSFTLIVGTIYAPNGRVEINSSYTYLVGNIIAKEIVLRGSYLYINDENKIKFKEDL